MPAADNAHGDIDYTDGRDGDCNEGLDYDGGL